MKRCKVPPCGKKKGELHYHSLLGELTFPVNRREKKKLDRGRRISYSVKGEEKGKE